MNNSAKHYLRIALMDAINDVQKRLTSASEIIQRGNLRPKAEEWMKERESQHVETLNHLRAEFERI